MNIDRLPDSLLNGTFLHCRPIENGQIVEAQIVPVEEEVTTFKVALVCLARLPSSKCLLRLGAHGGKGRCLYYKGDSRGSYQIIGPNVEKSDRGWK